MAAAPLLSQEELASQARFELTTFPLGGGRSIQLSYWDARGGSMLASLGSFVMLAATVTATQPDLGESRPDSLLHFAREHFNRSGKVHGRFLSMPVKPLKYNGFFQRNTGTPNA